MDYPEQLNRSIKRNARAAVTARTEDMSNAQIRKELYRLCEQFVTDNEIHCPETIWQMDHVIGNAHEFFEEMCNIIGYASIKDINEDDNENEGC